MSWLSNIGNKIASAAKGVVNAAKSVVNNPIIATVAKIAVPGVYNAVQAATSVVAKFQGTTLGTVVTSAASMVAPVPSISGGVAAPAATAPMSRPVELVKGAGVASTASYASNTARIVHAYGR